METIESAAIRWAGRVHAVPRPGRHHDVIRGMAAMGLHAGAMIDQGFVTSTGRFVSREEAARLALQADQIIDRVDDEGIPMQRRVIRQLFSEDVW